MSLIVGIPKITHLQFLVLHLLLNSIKTKEQLIKELKYEKSSEAFYQIMYRLEQMNCITIEYKINQVGRICNYSITQIGKNEYSETLIFYRRFL